VYIVGPSRDQFIRTDVVESFFAAVAVAVGEEVQSTQVKLVDVQEHDLGPPTKLEIKFHINKLSTAQAQAVAAVVGDASFQGKLHSALQICSTPTPVQIPPDTVAHARAAAAMSEVQFYKIFPMIAPSGSCSAHCKGKEGVSGNCEMYQKGGYEAFNRVMGQFPRFLRHTNPLVNKMELAAFLSNVFQETGLQEWATPWDTPRWRLLNDTVRFAEGFTPVWGTNPKMPFGLCYSFEAGAHDDGWLGRGVVQLTGDANYAQASFGMDMWDSLLCAQAKCVNQFEGSAACKVKKVLPPPQGVGADLCEWKQLPAVDVHMAWRTGIWFWMNKWISPGAQWGYTKYGKLTPNQLISNDGIKPTDFANAVASSIQAINGGLECLSGVQGFTAVDNGDGFARTMRRVNAYVHVLEELGVPAMVKGWDGKQVWEDSLNTCYKGGEWEASLVEQLPYDEIEVPDLPAADASGSGGGGTSGPVCGPATKVKDNEGVGGGEAVMELADVQEDGVLAEDPNEQIGFKLDPALPLPWVRDTHSVCAHGGDPSSCTGHGGCSNQGYNYLSMPVGMNGLQSHWPELRAANNTYLRMSDVPLHVRGVCICDEGWAGKACSVNTNAMYEGNNETVDPVTQMALWDGLTFDINGNSKEKPGEKGAAGWSQYMQLTYASGTCAQSWTFNPGQSLPYRLQKEGGSAGGNSSSSSSKKWRFTERIQGVTASNNLQYGERVLRQAHGYPNPSVSCNDGSLSGDWQPSGQNCGQCWEVIMHDGQKRTLVALDRCGGGCYGYPASGVTADDGCKYPERFTKYAGKGANWRRLIDDGETDKCLGLLTRDDCANFFIAQKGFEQEPGRPEDKLVVCERGVGGAEGGCYFEGESPTTRKRQPASLGYALAMATSSSYAVGIKLDMQVHPTEGQAGYNAADANPRGRPKRAENQPVRPGADGPSAEGYRQYMRRAQGGIEWVDHCAANRNPHFDIDQVIHAAYSPPSHFPLHQDSTVCLGIDGVGTVAGYKPVSCAPIGVKPDGTHVAGVGWLHGCDRNGWTNCGNEKEYDPTLPDRTSSLCSGSSGGGTSGGTSSGGTSGGGGSVPAPAPAGKLGAACLGENACEERKCLYWPPGGKVTGPDGSCIIGKDGTGCCYNAWGYTSADGS
jgi:hypothetical protein